VANLLEVLKGDTALARDLLQQHIKKLLLFPSEMEGKPVFEVIGEMDLFETPGSAEYGVLLGCSGTQKDQQPTVDRYLRFVMRLDPNVDDKCPLLEPLCLLLQDRPELALEPRTPTEWAKLLNESIPDGPTKPKRLGYGMFSACMRKHRTLLEQRFVIKMTPNPVAPPGHLYQLALRPTCSVSRDEDGEVLAA
jgi:hypothetical protein